MSGKRSSKAEQQRKIELLRSLAGTVFVDEIGAMLGWKRSTVRTWASKLGISLKSEEGKKRMLASPKNNVFFERELPGQSMCEQLWKIPNVRVTNVYMGYFTQ